MASDTPKEKNLEWEERTLCSDEACIGIIGPRGRCNECGKPYAGKAIGTKADETDDMTPGPLLDPDDADDDEPEVDEVVDRGDADNDDDQDWEERILCRDESCIGVIGPDGRCKECGLPLEAEDD